MSHKLSLTTLILFDLYKGADIRGLENTTFTTERATIGSGKLNNSTRAVLRENNGGLVNQTNGVNSTTESRWLTPTPHKAQSNVALLHQNDEMIDNGNARRCSSREGEFEPHTENNGPLIANQIATVAEDPNVVIKHSSDPYSDFRMSMVTMIEEEGLQVMSPNYLLF